MIEAADAVATADAGDRAPRVARPTRGIGSPLLNGHRDRHDVAPRSAPWTVGDMISALPATRVVVADDGVGPHVEIRGHRGPIASHGERIDEVLGDSSRIVRVSAAAHALPRTHPEPVDIALTELMNRLNRHRTTDTGEVSGRTRSVVDVPPGAGAGSSP